MSGVHEILVAVDFSEGSKAALAHASFVAQRLGANLHVLHVFQVPEFVPPPDRTRGSPPAPLAELLETQAKEQLAGFVGAARARGVTVAHAFTESGPAWSSIIDVARRQRHDLIVLGTSGRTGLAHALLGSTAERVVRRAPCPVLTVRETAAAAAAAPKRILVPVDYSEGSRQALVWAAGLSRSLGAELEVVHVWDRPAYVSGDTVVHGPGDRRRSLSELIREGAERAMQDFLASFALPPAGGSPAVLPHRLLAGEPASTLIAELAKGEYDLVVLGTHGRTGFRHFLLGSIAEKLVRYAPVPVVTVPSPVAAG